MGWILTFLLVTAAAAGQTTEEQAVRVPLETYIKGHSTGDPLIMRQAFRPTAHIEGIRNGQFVSWTVDEYCFRFNGSASDEKDRVRKIDHIEISGTVAMARMTLLHGSTKFTDMFVLLKENGKWLIANKAYHAEPARR